MWNEITDKERDVFNALATHPLQSFEWGEFRKKTGVKVIRKGLFQPGADRPLAEKKKLIAAFQMTIHKIPHTPFTIGYIPKGTLPTHDMISELKKIGKEERCIFIQLEPNVKKDEGLMINDKRETNSPLILNHLSLIPSTHPLFTKYTFILDLSKSEELLLQRMHPKTRYNIKIAQKHNVTVKEDSSEKAFESYLQLTKETTNRQGFFAHTPTYHRKMWETLRAKSKEQRVKSNLEAHLLMAYYSTPNALSPLPLTAWILFVFHDTLYYPYGASSNLYREAMASNKQMWEAIKFGKKLGLKSFDMWGSLGESPNPTDPWFGFHKFKQGYDPQLVEFIGSYDLVINPMLYQIYKLVDKLRGMYLSIKR